MRSVFLDVLKPEIDEMIDQREAKAFETVAERLINKGYTGSAIADATGYDRTQINSIAQRLNRTVTWGEARA